MINKLHSKVKIKADVCSLTLLKISRSKLFCLDNLIFGWWILSISLNGKALKETQVEESTCNTVIVTLIFIPYFVNQI